MWEDKKLHREFATTEPMQPIDHLLWHRRAEGQNQVQEKANQNDSNETTQAAAQNINRKYQVFTPELRLTDRRLLNFHEFLKLSDSNPRRLI